MQTFSFSSDSSRVLFIFLELIGIVTGYSQAYTAALYHAQFLHSITTVNCSLTLHIFLVSKITLSISRPRMLNSLLELFSNSRASNLTNRIRPQRRQSPQTALRCPRPHGMSRSSRIRTPSGRSDDQLAVEILRGLGRLEKVVDLLQHLPYLRENDDDEKWQIYPKTRATSYLREVIWFKGKTAESF